MKTAAIIAEYNPFHRGHAYQLSKVEADFVVAIMSGSFVQRGEPAIFDKWLRTEIALANGIDLVLELPVPAAAGSAEYFAEGAVFLLEQSQIIDRLYFGAEHPELPVLQKLAELLITESPEFSLLLKSSLKAGASFAAARQTALESLFPEKGYGAILKGSNNILAIEYLKALKKMQSTIQPCLIQRQGQDYLDGSYRQDTLMSATAIRKLIRQADEKKLKEALPSASFEHLSKFIAQKNGAIFPEDIYPFALFLLIQQPSSALLSLREQKPQLLNRFYRYAHAGLSFDEYIHACSSRNFPLATVKRALMQIFLNQPPFPRLTRENSYLKVLGFRRSAAPLLRRLQESSQLPVITNTRHSKTLPKAAALLYQNELRCDRLYAQLLAQKYSTEYFPPEKRNPIVLP